MASSKASKKLTIGADPEVLLIKQNSNVPAWDYTEGRKDAPVPFFRSEYGTFLAHSDNVAFELNFPKSQLGTAHFRYMATQIGAFMNEHLKCKWKAVPYAEFDTASLEHPLAQSAGCSEDFCAYDVDPSRPRPPPVINSWGNRRFFGGHIHIGYVGVIDIDAHVVARFCDLYLGAAALAGGYDKQGPRREYYGQAGIFRDKAYGLEYRTLSNFWLEPGMVAAHAMLIENGVRNMLAFIKNSRSNAAAFYNEFPWGTLREAINEENTERCAELVGRSAAWISENCGGSQSPCSFG